MKIDVLNIGSLNIDKVYSVESFVEAGETISANDYNIHFGGKGLNQSIALSRCGIKIAHAGCIGKEGEILRQELSKNNVDTSLLLQLESVTGHAIIQVNKKGQNCIIVYPGANGQISKNYIDYILTQVDSNCFVLLQNETSNVSYSIAKAKELGFKIAFNPSPITDNISTYPLELVDILFVNEIEAKAIANSQLNDNEQIINSICNTYPTMRVVMTLGKDGVLCKRGKERIISNGIYDVPVVDTTAAGDTFTGFFLGLISKGYCIEDALEYSSIASSLAVSKKGASSSIPYFEDVIDFKNQIRKETI